jgi:hypothetical protein
MSLLVKKEKERTQTISPAVHLEFIQNQAGLPEAESVAAIEAYHRALFLHHHAADLEKYEQQARVHLDRLAHLENRLQETTAKLARLDALVPADLDGEADIRPSMPWNAWDAAMFATAFLGIAGLLLFGVLNISFNLLESGLVTFVENPVRAYFWAALLPVGALAVKVGWDVLRNSKVRDVYLWSSLAIGIAAVFVWVAAYASVYPTLSKSVDEHIESLSVFDQGRPEGAMTAAGAKWVDVVTVAAQAVAEIFLSAVLGIYMTMIYAKHRTVRLVGNPLFTQVDEEGQSFEENIARERMALGEAKGNRTRLENQLVALLAYAKSMFQKELALRRDQSEQRQAWLDELSQHLRTQLETMPNGTPARKPHGLQPASNLDRQNES